jgi:hypothetical protein
MALEDVLMLIMGHGIEHSALLQFRVLSRIFVNVEGNGISCSEAKSHGELISNGLSFSSPLTAPHNLLIRLLVLLASLDYQPLPSCIDERIEAIGYANQLSSYRLAFKVSPTHESSYPPVC